MRYMNWDVLLFPEGSKVPLQEFKTGCFVTQDPDSTHIQTAASTGGLSAAQIAVPRQVPTVACFIPNLMHGCPFRVSLHSWQPPEASRATKAIAPFEGMIFFEARVLLDGICVAGILFNQQPPWPQIIVKLALRYCLLYDCLRAEPDASAYVIAVLDKAGNHDLLRFPPFHQEMVTQSWWNAGENMGRIRVVVAEGLVHGQGMSSFERIRNVVSFSFQHAPLKVLEDSGIAWPNPGMWYQPPHQLYNIPSPRKMDSTDPDVHAHSPCHRDKQKDAASDLISLNIPLSAQGYIPPAGLRSHGLQLEDPYWSSAPLLPDPFIDDERHPMSKKRAGNMSSEDQSMPDYSRAITPAGSRNISSHTIGQDANSGSPAPEESQFEELMAALSPHKDIIGGTLAPANTRVSSKINTPSIQSRPSNTPEARTLSYSRSQSRSASASMRDPARLINVKSFDDNVQSHNMECVAAPFVSTTEMKKNPARDIKGRKEGRTSDLELSAKIQKTSSERSNNSHEQENSIDSEDKPIPVCDAKRKRENRILSIKSVFKNDTSPSPGRKYSKIESKSESDSDDEDEILASKDIRPPLTMLENVH